MRTCIIEASNGVFLVTDNDALGDDFIATANNDGLSVDVHRVGYPCYVTVYPGERMVTKFYPERANT